MSREGVKFLEEHKRLLEAQLCLLTDRPYLGAFANGYGEYLLFEKTPRTIETIESWISVIDGIIGRANAPRT
jgi:hypothetical protein